MKKKGSATEHIQAASYEYTSSISNSLPETVDGKTQRAFRCGAVWMWAYIMEFGDDLEVVRGDYAPTPEDEEKE